MSVNVKQNGDLVRIANNYSIVQADWNEEDVNKSSHIKNQPTTLKTLDEIAASTDEGALAGASALKELMENGGGGTGSIIKVQLSSTKGNTISNVGITLNIKNEEYSSTTDSNGVAIFNGVTEVGTMTVTAAAEEFPSQTFKIEFFGSYELIMVDSDPYEDWLAAAGLNPASYEDIDELLEDEAAVRALMTKTAAVDILASYITGERLEKIINHRYAAKWINYREYAYSTLSANEIIKELMDASGMYGMYITTESKCRPLVPILTSNNGSDGGEAFSNSNYTGYYPYMAFNNNDVDCWHSAQNVKNTYVGYKFTKPTKVNKLSLVYGSGLEPTLDMTLQASNNGSEWVDLIAINNNNLPTYTSGVTSPYYYEIKFDNERAYMQYRLFSSTGFFTTDNSWFGVNTLQFYGYQLEALIPPMTSNTSPSGEASASTEHNDGSVIWNAWKAFKGNDSTPCWSGGKANTPQWLQYKFDKPMYVKVFEILPIYDAAVGQELKNYEILASNDGTKFDILYTGLAKNDGSKIIVELNADKAYTHYRVNIIDSYRSDPYKAIKVLQFYGEPTFWQPKGLVPVMTSNTAPYGEVSSSGYQQTMDAYKAFNNTHVYNSNDSWVSTVVTNPWLQYKFVNPTCVSKIYLENVNNTAQFTLSVKDFVLQGSNDASTWDDLGSFTNTSNDPDVGAYYDIDNTEYYLYYRITCASLYGTGESAYACIGRLQFYGRQLEALIPPMTSNTTPIGKASASSEYSADYAAWKAFDGTPNTGQWNAARGDIIGSWIQYKFVNPTIVNSVYMKAIIASNYPEWANIAKEFTIKASNDGSTWDDLYNGVNTNAASGKEYIHTFKNSKHYMYYRLYVNSIFEQGESYAIIGQLQFYGTPDYESRNYIYDHGVEVMEITSDGYGQNTVIVEPITKGNDSINVRCEGKKDTGVMGGTNSKIDFTNYKILCLRYKNNLAFNNSGLYVVSNKLYTGDTAAQTSLRGNVNGIYTIYLDVNNIKNDYYTFVRAFWTSETVANKTQDFDVFEWWLE